MRHRILCAASDHFLVHGYRRTAMDQLASQLGISKKTLYRLFPDKQALLHAVVTKFLKETASSLEEIVQRPDWKVDEKLARLMEYLSHRLSSVSLSFLLELEKKSPELWDEIQNFRRRRLREIFVRLYGAGRRQGLFVNYPDPELTIHLYLNLVQSVMSPQSLMKLGRRPSEVARAIITIFLCGLFTEEARKKFLGKRKTFYEQSFWQE